MFSRKIVVPALIEDINGVIVDCGSNTGVFIQDDTQAIQIPLVPSTPALSARVGVLLQNVSAPDIIDSDLGDSRLRPLPE